MMSDAEPSCFEPTWREEDRLAALESYSILDTGREAAFDEVAGLAADLLDAPIAVVNLIAADRQWFKAEVGIGTDSLPLDVSICRHAILQPGVMVVPDLQLDPRFEANPLVTAAGGLRFYAGALLETPDGLPLGTVCVLDREARPDGITERQRRVLTMLASQAMAQIELRRARDEAQQATRRQAFLLALSDALRPLSDPGEIRFAAASVLGRHLGASRVAYAEDLGDGRYTVLRNYVDGALDAQGVYRYEDFGPEILADLQAGRVHARPDILSDPYLTDAGRAALTAFGIGASLNVPLLKEGQLVAFLGINFPAAHAFTPDEVELAQAVVERTWEAAERARAEAVVRESEERHRRTLEIDTVGIVYFDLVGGITDANDAFLRLIDYSREELEAGEVRYERLTPPDWWWRDEQTIRELQTTGHGEPFEKEYFRRDGSRLWILCASKMLDERTAVEFVVDVTERRRAEAALAQSEERLRLATEQAEVGFWDVEEGHGALTWPPRVKALFGIGADRPVTMDDFYAGLHPDDLPRVAEAYAAAADPVRRALYDVEYRTIGKEDGITRWVAAKGRGVFDREGLGARCLRMIGIAIDITARKEAEAALQESAALLSAVVDAVPVGVIIADAQGRIVRDNAANRELWGVPPETGSWEGYGEWVGYWPETGERIKAHEWGMARALLHGEVVRNELVENQRFGIGERRMFLNNAAPVRDRSGHVVAGVVAAFDVTERLAIERRLRELNETLEARVAERTAEREQLARIVETTGTLIQALDTELRWVAVNRATSDVLERLYGRKPRLGESLHEFFAGRPEHLAEARAPWDRALAGESFTVMAPFGDPGQERRIYELTFEVLRDGDDRIMGAFMTGFDVSDRLAAEAQLREAEEALRQSQKMEAMGQLTGGVAHDFNNLLTPIIGSLDRLVTRGVGSERERRLMAGALESAERAKTLVQRLLAFARRQPLQPVAVDMGALVEGMAGLIGSTLGPTIAVRLDLARDLPPAKADPNQLDMAILNLAVNARDAMPEGGTLTVAASRESVRGKHRSGLRQGHYVRLAVTDTGSGMDEATRARAVEPFFSTKGIGRGTGLGLSMVHGLAAQLGGGLAITSQPGSGTTVELWLPVSSEPVEATEADRAAPQPIVSRGCALLVDDEDLVRMSTADMLGDLGFDVLEAGSAEEALRLLRERAGVDLLVTDHLMPGMSGAELAREARALRPGLPVLIVSGYAEVDGIASDLPRLVKPFRQAELSDRVAALLPTAAPAG